MRQPSGAYADAPGPLDELMALLTVEIGGDILLRTAVTCS
jgi:hypothetical protein